MTLINHNTDLQCVLNFMLGVCMLKQTIFCAAVTLLLAACGGQDNQATTPKSVSDSLLGAIDNSKKEAKDLRYCFHATIPNLCHVPKHAYK